MKIKYYLKEMRVHHYIKNILVFIPLACSGQVFDYKKLLAALFVFLSFCFMSSAIYIINDIRDVGKDRNHPTKCKRPIAAGNIKIKPAIGYTIFLIVIASIFSILCSNVFVSALIVLYFIINMGYSFGLKNIPLLDVAILVAGFLIRVLCGAIVTDIRISSWLYLVVISAAFYLCLGKRRNELKKQSGGKTRQVIKKYPFAFLASNMYMCMALIFVFYALWTVDEKTIAVYHSEGLIWTVPLVMVIFMKYSLTVEGNSDGDPVEVLIHDKGLLALCVFYIVLMFSLLYLKG